VEGEEQRVDFRTDRIDGAPEELPVRREEERTTVLLVGAKDDVEVAVRSAMETTPIELSIAEAGDEARSALVAQRFDVVLIAEGGPQGGAAFAQLVARLAPTSKTMLLSRTMTVDAVVHAMRRGVVDYVQVPFDPNDFRARLVAAVDRSRDDRAREERVVRLKGICKKLSDARAEFSEQARALTEDLKEVREGIEERMDEVAMTAEYRTLLRQELDLEELLRVGVEYLIAKTGPSNAAVFLPGGDGAWSLGAYVNYDCPRQVAHPMLERLATDLCPELCKSDDLMRFQDSHDFIEGLGLGDTALAGTEIVAWPCLWKTDCLAVFVLFRDGATGFTDELASMIDALRGVFAEQVATVLRIHHRASGGWPAERADDEDERDDWEDRRAA
jgi:DNA-binding response OmpR family regulator